MGPDAASEGLATAEGSRISGLKHFLMLSADHTWIMWHTKGTFDFDDQSKRRLAAVAVASTGSRSSVAGRIANEMAVGGSPLASARGGLQDSSDRSAHPDRGSQGSEAGTLACSVPPHESG